jgi:signal transduction histidine kinase
MNLPPPLASRVQIERVIAGGRVALAAASLVGLTWAPGQQARFVAVTYTLSGVYLAYAAGLFTLAWTRPIGERLPLVTHVADIAFVTVLQYFTAGPSSPFFLYFVFSLFSATLRWDWEGTLWTAAAVLLIYVVMTAWMSLMIDPLLFEGDRFATRSMYIVVVAAMLAYLSRHHERVRGEIDRLARWPQPAPFEPSGIADMLQYAAQLVGAGRVVVVWEAGDEPDARLACWPEANAAVSKHRPGELTPVVSATLEHATFVAAGPIGRSQTMMVAGDRGRVTAVDGRLHPRIAEQLAGQGLASAPFSSDRVVGRVFFSDFASPAGELVPLTEVVAREIGSSLDRLSMTEQLTELATREERIRLARDLHDGVLQSLTGIRLEIGALAGQSSSADDTRLRLTAIERALAIEQRELRLFIGGLGPTTGRALEDTTLAARLDAMRERIALEWHMPVTVRCSVEMLPPAIDAAVPLMVHEAIVNALKHGQPSRVAVTIDRHGDRLSIVVADDGHGFPFRGRYTHAALAKSAVGPKSLLERVQALGGEITIDSTDGGARVEMTVDLATPSPATPSVLA